MSTYNIRLSYSSTKAYSYSSTKEHIGYHYTAISSYPQSGNYNSEENVITATCKITELKLIEGFELALEIHTHDSKCEFNGCLGLEAYALANTLALALALALIKELEDELTYSLKKEIENRMENMMKKEPASELFELGDVDVQELTNTLEKELAYALENVHVKLENVQKLVENALDALEFAIREELDNLMDSVREYIPKYGMECAKDYVLNASEELNVEELKYALAYALENAQEELKNVQKLKENGN